jgi:hypothetical protein
MSKTSIAPIHTPCKKCVFAKYDVDTQVDCYLGLIEEYKKVPKIEVLEAYDGEKEFYVINNKKCAGYKEEGYFVSRNMEDKNLEDKISYVKDRLKLNYMVIINAITVEPDELQQMMNEIAGSDVTPKLINIVISEKSKYPFNTYYKAVENSGVNAKWKLTHVRDAQEPFEVSMNNILSLNAKKHNFALIVDGDYDDIQKVVNTANHRVYKEFARFVVFANKSHGTKIFNQTVYRNGLYHGVNILREEKDYEIV